jgi:hypothetical protein
MIPRPVHTGHITDPYLGSIALGPITIFPNSSSETAVFRASARVGEIGALGGRFGPELAPGYHHVLGPDGTGDLGDRDAQVGQPVGLIQMRME